MDERIVQFRVGVMVLATMIITGILILLFGEAPDLVQQTYKVQMYFDESTGIQTNSPVRKSGILIGRVTEVDLDDEEGGVWVTAAIDAERKLRENEIPRITGSLLGDATIEIVGKRGAPPTKKLIQPGEKLKGEVIPPPVEAFNALQDRFDKVFAAIEKTTHTVEETGVALQEAGHTIQTTAQSFQTTSESVKSTSDEIRMATAKFQETAESINKSTESFNKTSDSIAMASGPEWQKVGNRVNNLLDGKDDRVVKLLEKAEKTLANIDQSFAKVGGTAEDLQKLINDPKLRGNLDKTLEQLPQAISETRTAIGNIDLVVKTANRNLEHLEGVLEPLGKDGEKLVAQLSGTVAEADVLLEQLSLLAQGLNEGKGTIGELLTNPDLYQNVNASAEEVYQLLRALTPIIKDVRVFTDKIARHPEVLGLRGAFDQSSGIK